MHTEPDRDYFLLTAMEWATLRAETPPAVSREAALCHLLFQAGKMGEVLARLRTLCRDLLGVALPEVPAAPDAGRTLGAAADLLYRLRLAAAPGEAVMCVVA